MPESGPATLENIYVSRIFRLRSMLLNTQLVHSNISTMLRSENGYLRTDFCLHQRTHVCI